MAWSPSRLRGGLRSGRVRREKERAMSIADARRDARQAERLLTVNEAAVKLGVKRATMYEWARERRIPTVKLFGRALRFRESDLEKLIRGSMRPAAPLLEDSEPSFGRYMLGSGPRR